MQEEILYQYWHYYALSAEEIALSGGHRLRILYEGEFNLQKGPDIRFARFALDGIIYQGDVEFHLSARDWYRHGHHLDKAYANVLLHLTAAGTAEPVRHSLSTEPIPTYLMPLPVPQSGYKRGSANCIPDEAYSARAHEALPRMAVQRLEFKISAYRAALENSTPETLFYRQFFDALGFSKNRLPFMQLARKIPLSLIKRVLDNGASAEMLLALYFAQAGFLSVKNPDAYTLSLTDQYKRHRFLLQTAAVTADNWNLHLLRPQNHPQFRLAAWVFTLQRYHPRFLLESIERLLRERLEFPLLKKRLFYLFDIIPQGYWQEHFALNKTFNRRNNRRYWGRERLSEIIINVILPLVTALADKEGSYGFSQYLKQFYLWLPADISYGVISRNMPWYTAYEQILPRPALMQALLYLNENFCRNLNCAACPLKHRPFINPPLDDVYSPAKNKESAVFANV